MKESAYCNVCGEKCKDYDGIGFALCSKCLDWKFYKDSLPIIESMRCIEKDAFGLYKNAPNYNECRIDIDNLPQLKPLYIGENESIDDIENRENLYEAVIRFEEACYDLIMAIIRGLHIVKLIKWITKKLEL